MNPIFTICNAENQKIRIKDLTQESEEYIPESIKDLNVLQNYYYNNKFKYSETITINIIQYTSVKETSLLETTFTEHTSYLDEAYANLEKDGFYTVTHIIVPSLQWLVNELQKEDNFTKFTNKNIYVSDGQKIYQYLNGELKEKPIEIFIDLNVEDTTISRVCKQTFAVYYLYQCYITICKEILNNAIIDCHRSNSDLQSLIFKRDFLKMTISVLQYHIEFNQLYEAQRILETVNYCGTFCSNIPSKKLNNSGCGCGN